jgi:carbon monoxide dehydrogenase subunit G
MQFQHVVPIEATPTQVWDLLWDVDRLARCIPGCAQAGIVVPHERYSALIVDRVGPLKVKMPLDLVVESAVTAQSLHVIANGKDSLLGSSARIDIHADLAADGTNTALQLRVDVAVSGKIAGLGVGLFKRKFDDIMDQFGTRVKAVVEETATSPSSQ